MTRKSISTVTIATLSSILLTACLGGGKSVFYGRQTIKLPSGKVVYVKTMVWGITSDYSITTLSETRELYDLRNAKSDYVFASYLPRLFYRTEGNTLILYDYDTFKPPETGQFPRYR